MQLKRRTVEFTDGNLLVCAGQYADTYGSGDRRGILLKTIEMLPEELQKRVYVPHGSSGVEVSYEDIIDIEQNDPDTLYILYAPYISDMYMFDNRAKTCVGSVLVCATAGTTGLPDYIPTNENISEDIFWPAAKNILFIETRAGFSETRVAAYIKEFVAGHIMSVEEIARRALKKCIDTACKNIEARERMRGEEYKKALGDYRREQKDLQKELITLTGKINDTNLSLERWTHEDHRESILTQKVRLQELQDYKQLTSFFVIGDKAIYNTVPLALKEQKGYMRPIGDYTITVDMESADVTFSNNNNLINMELWDEVYGDDTTPATHPHCNGDGKPCMGNMAMILPDLCADKDYVGIWQVVLSFATSYNEHDEWGRRARYWDAVDADGNPVCIEKCHICGCELDPLNQYYIDDDGVEVDDDPLWEICSRCGKYVCSDCYGVDEEGAVVCNKCKERTWCERCNVCHSESVDWIECEECHEQVCEKHVVTSEVIVDNYGEGAKYCSNKCMEAAELEYYDEHPEKHPDYVEPEEEEVSEPMVDEDVEEPLEEEPDAPILAIIPEVVPEEVPALVEIPEAVAPPRGRGRRNRNAE